MNQHRHSTVLEIMIILFSKLLAIVPVLHNSGKVQRIHATTSAFATISENGEVVTWGKGICGGDSSGDPQQANLKLFDALLWDLPFSFHVSCRTNELRC